MKYRVGLIGAGIQQSGSPRIHMDEAASLGLDYSYELLDIDAEQDGATALPRLLTLAEQQGYAGLNITYPCKQAVLPLLHELSPEASALQAVNTVVLRNGKRIGHNTDWWGFAENFCRRLAPVPLHDVVLVGAGGAGAAAAYAVLRLGVERLWIHDADSARATALAERMTALFPRQQTRMAESLPAVLEHANGLIHATPMGMVKLPGLAVPPQSICPPLWVAEIVYVPLETALLALARARGCRVLDGGGMAVLQAAQAFTLFCGHVPDYARMLARFPAQAQC